MTKEQQEILDRMRQIVKERDEARALLAQRPPLDAAQRASLGGAFALIRTALKTMNQETAYAALAGLALNTLDHIEQEYLR